MNAFSFQVMYYIAALLPLMAGIAELVFAIIILAGKARSVKILGIGFIAHSLSYFMNVFRFIAQMRAQKLFAVYARVSNYVSVFCAAVILLSICIFLHKNYGKKLIYVPVFAIYAFGTVITRIVSVLVARGIDNSGRTAGMWITLTNNINSFVTNAAVAVIIMIVFIKYRQSEKVISKAWLCRVIMLAASFLDTMVICLYCMSLISGTKGVLRSGGDTVMTLALTIISLADLVFPIYVGLQSVKAAGPEKS